MGKIPYNVSGVPNTTRVFLIWNVRGVHVYSHASPIQA